MLRVVVGSFVVYVLLVLGLTMTLLILKQRETITTVSLISHRWKDDELMSEK